MLSKEALVSLLLLALGAVCVRPVSRDTGKAILKFSTGINTIGFSTLAEKDRARATAFARLSHLNERSSNTTTLDAVNAAAYYTARIGVGTPPTYHTLLLDTGSANTWVGADAPYVPTSSSVDTKATFSVLYGSAAVLGDEWIDTVTLSPDLVVRQQSIGVANRTVNVNGFDGILGLGPVDLTEGTVSDAWQVPTVMDNLYAQGSIPQEVLGVFLTPASEFKDNGELTLGGYDGSVTTSEIHYVPLTASYPACNFWGINQSISYGNTTILSSSAGIVDTGTTLILVATEAFQKYQSLTGGTLDSSTGLLAITPSQYANLQTLSFNIGDTSYDLVPNAQIWPRLLNSVVGGTSGAIYLVVADIGVADGAFFQFINGYTFLERYYSIYDTTSQRVGFAETAYTYADTN